MDKRTFLEYCKMFSTGDKAAVFDRFYDPDATFTHPLKGRFTGKDEIVGFWTKGHDGIDESLDPVNVMIVGDQVAAEFKVEWHCTEDTDYLGPRKKGEVYDSSCAAFYEVKHGKFVQVQIYQGPYSS